MYLCNQCMRIQVYTTKCNRTREYIMFKLCVIFNYASIKFLVRNSTPGSKVLSFAVNKKVSFRNFNGPCQES